MQKPNFEFESTVWRRGFKVVGGLDEVGRGSLSGPVVAGAVAFAPMTNDQWPIPDGIKIDDSKKLTARQRERADKWIKENAHTWGIGEASVATINRLGIGKATKVAFRRAITEANKRLRFNAYRVQKNPAVDRRPLAVDYVLIDAFFIPYTKGLRRKNQMAIVHGDEKSGSIAAASIIAKVYRDNLMSGLGKRREYNKYGWEKNKGYGTRDHRKAILKHGLTKYHRKTFVETFLQGKSSR